MLSSADNELLCRVENGAPMGAMIRQHYWIPAVPSSLLEPGGRPYRVRLLGTDLVAFRAPGDPAALVEALFQLAHFVGKLVEKLHPAHQALGLLAT